MSSSSLSVGIRFYVGAATILVAATVFVLVGCVAEPPGAGATSGAVGGSASADRARSQAAFVQIASVLRHPRCLNCHTVTDFPRQGDAGKRHAQFVLRGPDNLGGPAMRCVSCHTDANQANGVPGAPHWGLAPLSMGWEGLDDHQLAEALKDSAKNGQRSLEKLHEHMARDPLVAWGWNPGGTRAPPPISHAEFARLVREWIDTGAVSPDAK